MAATPIEIPILRHGRVYRSLDVSELRAAADDRLLARVDLANPGLVRRDARGTSAALRALSGDDVAGLLRDAAERFASQPLSLLADDPSPVSPTRYLELTAATTGLTPHLVQEQVELLGESLRALADLAADAEPAPLGCLAVVLPSNAPAVNRVWLPALASRAAVAIKPGAADPWTPARMVAALIAAGFPAEAFCFYPTSHAGADALLESRPRALLFGDRTVAEKHAHDPSVAVHGPGHSKVLLSAEALPAWRDHVDLLATSVADVGGRSCLNASTLVVPGEAVAIAEAVAEALLRLPADAIPAFSDPARARAISAAVDEQLASPGAEDVSLRLRGSDRVDGGRLLPTIVRCDDPAHALAQREYPFPFAAVVEVAPAALVEWLHPTLAATWIGAEGELVSALRASGRIARLTVGATPPTRGSSMAMHLANTWRLLS